MNLRIVGAILKKDIRSLYPLVLLATILFAGDVILMRLDVTTVWPAFRTPVLILAGSADRRALPEEARAKAEFNTLKILCQVK